MWPHSKLAGIYHVDYKHFALQTLHRNSVLDYQCHIYLAITPPLCNFEYVIPNIHMLSIDAFSPNSCRTPHETDEISLALKGKVGSICNSARGY